MTEVKILVVEDEGITARDIQNKLARLGYVVSATATSGAASIEQAAQARPDLVLMDIVLKGEMDGIEAADQIRARFDIPVVFLTAYADDHTLKRAKITEPFGYILKPFAEQDLAISIQMALYKHRVEARLRRREERLSSIFNNAAVGIALVDTSGRFTELNDTWCQMLGYTREELLTLTARDITPAGETVLLSGESQTGDKYRRVEKEYRCKDGSEFWADLCATMMIDSDGKTEGMMGIIVDITERKRAQTTLQQYNRNLGLLNQISQTLITTLDLAEILERLLQAAVAIVDAEGSSVWLWDERQTGELICHAILMNGAYHSPRDLRLRPGQGIAGAVAQSGKSAVIASTQQEPGFFPGIDKKTGFHTTSLLAVPLKMRDYIHGVLEVVNKRDTAHGERGQGFDADDRIVIEMLAASAAIAIDNARLIGALRQYGMELETRNEDLDAFAHTVAHDLKDPLGPIVGFAEALKDSFSILPAEDVRRHLNRISQNGRKMNNIIDELLLLAGVRKAEALAILPLDMGPIVAEAQERLTDMIREHQAEILAPEMWPVALGHGPWIEEVWVNFLSNAIKYGGRPPRVELGATPQTDDTVIFWIRDNGPGLTPEEQARIFKPFERLDRVRAQGHGLGLPIVRRIVEKLGGQVRVRSQVGAGSVFTFTLPSAPT